MGTGVVVATSFLVSQANQTSKYYAGLSYVNPDGTLDESMAPDGVFIHPNETSISGFDFAFAELALVGKLGPSGAVHSWFQTFPVFQPGEEDPPVLDGPGGSLDHHMASRTGLP